MYDASAKSFEQNLAETKEVVRIAHAVGVCVEAELGHIFASSVGSTEGGKDASSYASLEDCYTNPALAKEFVEATGVDALAIAFGTSHGVYTVKPVLDLERITAIKEKIDVPFVMHGGSGVSEEAFHTAICNGITKINYYTYMTLAGGEAAVSHINGHEQVFFHDVALAATAGMKANAKEAMRIFSQK